MRRRGRGDAVSERARAARQTKSVEQARRLMGDPSPEVARSAIARLLELSGAQAAGELRSRLLDADLPLVADIAEALRDLGDREAIEVALSGMRDASPARRLACARALAVLGGDRAAEALRTALCDEIAGVRAAAVDGLARLLADSDASHAAARLPADSDASHAAARLLSDEQPFVRIHAIHALARMVDHPGALLARAAHDPDALVREQLARHLASLPSDAARLLLGDRERAVRQAAARSAGVRELDALAALLRGDPLPPVRQAAAGRLGKLQEEPRVCDALLDALEDRDALVRVAALRSLTALLGEGRAVDRLSAELFAGRPQRRRASLYALARLSAREAAGAATALVEDPDPDVRMALVQCIGQLAADPAATLARLARDRDAAIAGAAATHLERARRRSTPGG